MISSFFVSGRAFSVKNALIFLRIISPSVSPDSGEDLRSSFSKGFTFPGTPRVAMMEEATR